jgi:hypothetical protein
MRYLLGLSMIQFFLEVNWVTQLEVKLTKIKSEFIDWINS